MQATDYTRIYILYVIDLVRPVGDVLLSSWLVLLPDQSHFVGRPDDMPVHAVHWINKTEHDYSQKVRIHIHGFDWIAIQSTINIRIPT